MSNWQYQETKTMERMLGGGRKAYLDLA